MIRLTLLVILLAGFCFPLPAAAEELRVAVEAALSSHPAIKGAEAGVDAAEHGVFVDRSGYFPEMSMNVTAGRVYQDNSTSRGLSVTRGAAYSGLGEATVSMRQMMFDGMETVNRVGASEARMQSRNYALLDTKTQITLRTAQSYIEILRLRSALQLLEKHTENIRDYEHRIAEMVDDGAADESELQQARDVSFVMDSIRADYEGQLDITRAQYFEATGEMPPYEMYVPPSLASYINDSVEEVVNEARNAHPLLQSARMDSQAARLDVRATKAGLYPDIAGEMSYQKADKRDVIGGESIDARAVLRMSWDFSMGGAQIYSARQKRSEQYEARAKADEIEREIERDIYQSYASYRTFKRKLGLAQERVALNEKLLSAYEAQFEAARINLLSLMRAESQFFNALLEESDNEFYLLSSEYGVLASLGTLKTIVLSDNAEGAQN